MNISIRSEQEKDYQLVEALTRAAFAYPERVARGGIGCPYEHWMVHELRKRDGIPELSLVAEADTDVSQDSQSSSCKRIVGHIICSKAEVRTSERVIPVLNFGPLSVLPAYQRQGVGSALIQHMIEKASNLGYGAILFFGRPEYYPQFGFQEASTWQITDSNGYQYPAFMGMELISNYLLHAKGGKFYESEIYDDDRNRNQVLAFDKQFKVQGLSKKGQVSPMAENKFCDNNVIARCVPMSKLQSVIGGKWKILILWYVSFYKVQRFGELMRRLDGITQSTLTKQLRELEGDGFLHREVFQEIPPRVEYSLTALGQSFIPVLQTMMAWSETHLCPDYENPYQA